jgi:hypothetical protein
MDFSFAEELSYRNERSADAEDDAENFSLLSSHLLAKMGANLYSKGC